jgi:P-type Cu2+ transporter
MTHTYEISGMTCQHCVARVQKALASHPDVLDAKVTQIPSAATVTMKRHLTEEELQAAVSKAGPYTIHEQQHS